MGITDGEIQDPDTRLIDDNQAWNSNSPESLIFRRFWGVSGQMTDRKEAVTCQGDRSQQYRESLQRHFCHYGAVIGDEAAVGALLGHYFIVGA